MATPSLNDFNRAEYASGLRLLNSEVRRLEDANAELQKRIALLERIDVESTPARWEAAPKKKGLTHLGMPVLFLSDLHFDEVVFPAQVEGVNRYNRRIALQRFQRVIYGTKDLLRNHISGLKYEGIHVLLGGDIFSGDIHEELRNTNEDTLYGGFDYWLPHVHTALLELAEEYKHVHIDAWTGNHGRNSDKPVFKNRSRDNIEWLFYRQLARGLATDKRITWNIPESPDCDVHIYGKIIRGTHGDQFRGGSGISGIMAPLMLGYLRKARRQASLRKSFDYLAMGHFHRSIYGEGLIVNASLKGYDEFAYGHNFPFERPGQNLFIITPEQGLSFPLVVFAEDLPR